MEKSATQKIHLCSICRFEFPKCGTASNDIWRGGLEEDCNVFGCKCYQPKEYQEAPVGFNYDTSYLLGYCMGFATSLTKGGFPEKAGDFIDLAAKIRRMRGGRPNA